VRAVSGAAVGVQARARSRATPATGREYGVLVVSTLVWGSLHPTAKVALQHLTPLQMSMLRPICACLVLCALVLVNGRGRQLGVELRRAPRTLLALGLLGYAGSSVLATFALDRLPAGITSLVANASPLMVVLGGWLLFHQRVQPVVVAGTVVGFAGVGVLGVQSASPTAGAGSTLIGIALALAAAATWAVYTGLARRLGRADPLASTALTSGIGAAAMTLVGLPTQDWSRLAEAPPSTYLAVLWAGGVATGLTYASWSFALRRLPAIAVAPFGYFIPVSGLAISHLWLGEPLNLAIGLGAAMVLAGVALTQLDNLRALSRALEWRR
jgi:drug/metabolite transporter (DMT)-like permease